MAYDAHREDYQRLGLRFAATLDNADAAKAARAFATFGRRFAQDRDSLPQTDADRAFHLVAVAAKLIDYELPFASDERARHIIEDGHRVLDEALSLDEHCYDALRMKAAADNNSFEQFLVFLNEQADEVRAWCEQRRDEAARGGTDERARLAAHIAMRPYVRWVATQAEEALICGRNREAIRFADMALEVDPHDGADVRFTAALAYAKLEDEEGLDALSTRLAKSGMLRPPDDAWTLLARIAFAFKRCDYRAAGTMLDALLISYPLSAEALIRQQELPDGVFARLAAAPYSEDELILAVSEGTVLLQEGLDVRGCGVFGSWIMDETARRRPAVMANVIAETMGDGDPFEGGGPGPFASGTGEDLWS